MITRKFTEAEQTPLAYRNDSFRQIAKMLNLPPTRISKMFGHTNNITVNRWLDGKEIYTHSLLSLCNLLKLDLLTFITYNGKTFQTNIADIVRMEEAGLNLRDLLEEHDVKPCAFEESRTLSKLTPHEAPATDDPSHPRHQPAPPTIGTPDPIQLSNEVIDKIISIQCNAYEHERIALEQQRADLQAIIDEKERQIAKLERELNKQKKQRTATTPYFDVVADRNNLEK